MTIASMTGFAREGGTLAEAGEHLLAGVREFVYQRCLPLATRDLTRRQLGRLGVDTANYTSSPAGVNVTKDLVGNDGELNSSRRAPSNAWRRDSPNPR